MSAVSAIESSCFLANATGCEKLTELSVQQIVSCCNTQWSQGCGGGFTEAAYFCAQLDGLESENTYPYTAMDGTCSHNPKLNVVKPMWLSFVYATPPCMDDCQHQNETRLRQVLRDVAPISICISASAWQTYSSGILEADCPNEFQGLNHCALCTGWGTDKSGVFYYVRNSWGKRLLVLAISHIGRSVLGRSWGQDGYIYIRAGKNLCGIADDATVVTIEPY